MKGKNMKATKTVPVKWILSHVNMMLKESTCSDAVRDGMCAVLECILHKTNNYKGFSYLDWINGGSDQWREDGKREFPEKDKYLGNKTRRVYY